MERYHTKNFTWLNRAVLYLFFPTDDLTCRYLQHRSTPRNGSVILRKRPDTLYYVAVPSHCGMTCFDWAYKTDYLLTVAFPDFAFEAHFQSICSEQWVYFLGKRGFG